jgi:hypothetical protein
MCDHKTYASFIQTKSVTFFYSTVCSFLSAKVCRCVCAACLCYNALPTTIGNKKKATMKFCQRRQVVYRNTLRGSASYVTGDKNVWHSSYLPSTHISESVSMNTDVRKVLKSNKITY